MRQANLVGWPIQNVCLAALAGHFFKTEKKKESTYVEGKGYYRFR
jgi:hypothetical protein